MEVRPEVGGRNSPHAAATSIRLLGLGHRWRPPTVKPTYFGLATLALFLFAFLVLISNNIAQAQTSTNTPPEFTNATVDRSVPENSPPGRSIGEPVAATDAENDLLTYGISGADVSLFGIHRFSGQITVGRWTALDYEASSAYAVTVTATDPSGASATISVTITVTDVNLGTTYDIDNNEEIDLAEVVAAVRDYFASRIDLQQVVEVIRLYFFSSPHSSTANENSLSDREALVALYHATDGPNWKYNERWLSESPIGAWYGVDTDNRGHVTNLRLYGNQLTGEIPFELGILSNLQELSLSGNS